MMVDRRLRKPRGKDLLDGTFRSLLKTGPGRTAALGPHRLVVRGIPLPDEIPDSEGHTAYVWPDALLNYLSAIGWPGWWM